MSFRLIHFGIRGKVTTVIVVAIYSGSIIDNGDWFAYCSSNQIKKAVIVVAQTDLVDFSCWTDIVGYCLGCWGGTHSLWMISFFVVGK